MKKTYFLLVFLIAFLCPLATRATHFKGGEIYFKCLGNGQYKLVFDCYYSCEIGSVLPSPASGISFTLTSSCAGVPISLTSSNSTAPMTVPDYCPGVLTTCEYPYSSGATPPAGTPDGTIVVTYSTDSFYIPAGCTVSASVDQGSRNNAISNLVAAGSNDIYLTTTIATPIGGGCGFSPAFVAIPISITVVGNPATLSDQVLSSNVDSIIYTLVSARTTSGADIPYVAGCDSTNPLGVGSAGAFASSFSLDRHDGSVRLTPTATGNYVIAVRVDAYSNGVITGSLQRDNQLIVVAASRQDNPPVLIDRFSAATVSGGAVIDSNTVLVCPGSTLHINLRATDPDSFNLVFDSIYLSTIPGAVVTVSHSGAVFDTATIHISWTPLGSDAGYHFFALATRDSICPRPSLIRNAFAIRVSSGLYGGSDQVHCIGGQPTTIQSVGGAHYRWSDIAGGLPVGLLSYSADSSAITVAPSVTSSYIVTSSLAGQCGNKDTIVVSTATLFSLHTTAQDSSLCRGNSTVLTTVGSPSSLGPFTYSWSPSVSAPHAASTATAGVLHSTAYHVTVVSAAGCAVSDSVLVRVSQTPPNVILSASVNNVCPGDTVHLHALVALGNIVQDGTVDTCTDINTGLSAQCYHSSDTIFHTAATSPFNGFYPGSRVQYIFHPEELYAAGMSSGPITDISFLVKEHNSTMGYENFTVSMGVTAQDSLTGFVSGLYTLTYPNMTYYPILGWNAIPFVHFYQWDGISNLVVQVCYSRSTTNFDDDDNIAYSLLPFSGATAYANDFGSGTPGCNLQTATLSNIRPIVRIGMCLPAAQAHYQWAPSTLHDTAASISAVVHTGTTYHFTATTPLGCSTTDSIRVDLNSLFTGTQMSQLNLCAGDTVQLSVFSTSYHAPCIQDYHVSSIPYAPLSGVPAYIPVNSYHDAYGTQNTDDGTAGPFTLPFAFPFYCGSYSQLWVNTNGWISMADPYPGTTGGQQYVAQTLPPTPANIYPMKMIALMMGDYGLYSGQQTVGYFTAGIAPARTFVMQFDSMIALSGSGHTTGQIQLHEADGSIDILVKESSYAGTNHTTGIKDSIGIGLAAPGRNNAQYTITTPEAWHFAPMGDTPIIQSCLWSPAAYLNNDTLTNPLAYPPADQTYIVNANVVLNPSVSSAVCHIRDTVSVGVGHLSVWPGDVNDDHIADNNDILYLGIAYGDTGTVRANASIVWVAQCAEAWDSSFAGGVNCVHADCDGDGRVGYSDTLAVYANFGLTHPKTNTTRSSNLNLTITTDKAQYDVNDTITASIYTADAANVIPGIYGIAYDFDYTSHGAAHIVSVDQSMSWLNRKLDFRKVTTPATAYLAQSRIDKRDTSGYGKIAELKLRIDSVASTADLGYLGINGVLALNRRGDTIYLNPASKTVVLNSAGVGVEPVDNDRAIDIYPNPNTGLFRVVQSSPDKVMMTMTDAIGREVYSRQLIEKVTNVDLSTLPEGVYITSFSAATGKSSKRLVITR